MKNVRLFFPVVLLAGGLVFMMAACKPKAAGTDAPAEAAVVDTAWKQLFNGTDLTGWKHVGDGFMTVEDGVIRTHGGMGLLYWTGGKVGNCQLHIEWRMEKENSNSGVFIKVPVEPLEAWMPVYYGYEVQVDNHPETSGEDDYHYTGGLYSFTYPKVKAGLPGPDNWNSFDITMDGPHVTVLVNGQLTTDYMEGDSVPERKFDFEPFHGPRPDSGWFGLQNHGEHDVVFYRKVAIRPIVK